ncbi:MAG TPA: rRNA maturation RNase YbeY [Pseudomonadales bacterium]|nr:rRNA maturation RNase YbeY [Pseudomonadales bacterium]
MKTASPSTEVDIDNASEAPVPDAEQFRLWVDAAVAGRRDAALVSIRIVDEDEGRDLNVEWRGKDYSTNVLSFPANLPKHLGIPLLGDLIMCAPVVASEAAAQGKTETDHWAHMTIHGVLHLLGYDHEKPAEAERMEALERQILAGLGIADPYL